MKKVKIMLTSIAVLAVVGGALAFKAKFDQTFCYTDPTIFRGAPVCTTDNAIPLLCDVKLVAHVTDINNGQVACTAPLNATESCDDVQCQDLTYTKIDE